MSKVLSIIIPVYNEEGAIESVLRQWHEELDKLDIDYQICAYNDGSKDQTMTILNKLKPELPNLVVVDKANSGHGPTILKGYIDNLDSEWIFQVDSDDEMQPTWFKEIWAHNKRYDFIIGSRYGRTQALPRFVLSVISRLTIRTFFGGRIHDVNSPFRLMRVKSFKDCFLTIPSHTFAPNIIITGYAAYNKLQAAELDVPQRDRQTGEVSLKKWKLFKAGVLSLLQTIIYRLKFMPSVKSNKHIKGSNL
ncbi:MAG: glycosyltransferase family 2 protein [Bacteriovoracaceae bacterium]|jgi:glycosyltransferase involved in cell wall biosynthesis|nr:glycosyltransferase family 2 protein [Bacteriovoracaceae bacterium]